LTRNKAGTRFEMEGSDIRAASGKGTAAPTRF
jgi:hypothetical protein